MKRYDVLIFFVFLLSAIIQSCSDKYHTTNRIILDENGAVIRKDTTHKKIYLVFTGHDFAEGFPVIKGVLDRYGIKASFFFTGDFYRNPDFADLIGYLKEEGHYMGAHSDKHLLYCSWEKRDSLLIDKATFIKDLNQNYKEMEKFGIEKKDAVWFMPPYEWYNNTVSEWVKEMDLILVNFSPGTRSNADYTYPELEEKYVSSGEITESILHYEERFGMNGFILLIHIGTDPRRKDKYYYELDYLIGLLEKMGYDFGRIDE
jgi:peptidoglycan/xylan/chitin deacetylase (PgdA/CDA1 family)